MVLNKEDVNPARMLEIEVACRGYEREVQQVRVGSNVYERLLIAFPELRGTHFGMDYRLPDGTNAPILQDHHLGEWAVEVDGGLR